jgi:hypothetical protein
MQMITPCLRSAWLSRLNLAREIMDALTRDKGALAPLCRWHCKRTFRKESFDQKQKRIKKSKKILNTFSKITIYLVIIKSMTHTNHINNYYLIFFS